MQTTIRFPNTATSQSFRPSFMGINGSAASDGFHLGAHEHVAVGEVAHDGRGVLELQLVLPFYEVHEALGQATHACCHLKDIEKEWKLHFVLAST